MPQLTVKNAAKMQTKNLFRFFCNPSKKCYCDLCKGFMTLFEAL